ncbi:MAG: hypothetical protein HOP07_05665 [Bacteriovoracaceae bacterium]|nr:hypothetical protein [Bacteriovoracaceae bacterium]
MKSFLLLSVFIFMTDTASADIYLNVGDSVNIGSSRVHCGMREPAPSRMYRCSMKICIDPWNRESDNEWMCKNASAYKMESRSAIGDDKNSLYQELVSRGIHDSDSFSCEEI